MASYTPVDLNSPPASAANKTVFLLGITGYVGGTVFEKLLTLPVPPKLITALVRDKAKAETIASVTVPEGITVKALVGGLDDFDLLVKAASEHDVTFNCAHADHVEGTRAILEGQARRQKATGHRPLLIHTSGTGLLTDNAKGEYPGDKIYTDLNPTPAYRGKPALLSVDSLPDTALHRNVDLAIIDADAKGLNKSYIVIPSTIFGIAKGQVFDKGIANPMSIQIPTLIRAAIDRGQAGIIGKGENIWPYVHISDIGDLFKYVYYGALRGGIGHGKTGYYFGEAGEYTYFAVASTIGAALVDLGLIKAAQPTSFTEEDIKKYYNGGYYAGTNSRCRAERSKSLGWRPKYAEDSDFFGDIKAEIAAVQQKK